MAKKKVAQEPCFLCMKAPCECPKPKKGGTRETASDDRK